MESSYDIVESSRYILRDCSHISTTEIDLYSSIVMAKKNNAKKCTADARAKHFCVGIVFERWVGQ
mgnify:CR=1 FL=1